MKLLYGLVVALACLYAVSASSSGLLSYCNTDLKYGKGTSVMPWVVPVANATFYTIRSGDIGDISNDPTSYIPGKLQPIHIRTYDLNRIFIGIVLYAVDSTGKKVGTWTIPTGTPFQNPPTCEAVDGVGTVVTHSDADLKPLHVVFWWQAPAGTGKVTFKILIKQGEQNKGWFWYPAKRLTLTEGTAPSNDQYVLANTGETCVSACSKQTELKYCDATTTALMRGQNSMTSPITAAGAACLLPLLSGCSDMAPFRTSDFHCFYKTDSQVCSDNGRGLTATDASVCHYSDSTGQRFCACTSNNGSDVITGTIPTTDDTSISGMDGSSSSGGGSGDLSAASRSTSGIIVCLLVAAVGSLFGTRSSSSSSSSRSAMMMMIALVAVIAMIAIIPTAEAHNWVGNPSRATVASVTKPCQRRIGNQPHVQVVANQTFQTEWSVGHGDSGTKTFYFVVLHSDDLDRLLEISTKDLDRYIAEAPTSAWMFNATMWKKRHITSTTDPDWVWGYFDRVPLAKNDSRYIARDSAMNSRGKIRYSNNNFNEYFFYPNHTIMDARVEYQSINYPWIESVHRFRNVFAEHNPFAHQYNLANFKVPARKGAGDYILHFWWGGYRDCVDVNVQPKTMSQQAIVNRYGIYNTSATTSWFKREHCEFFFIMNALTQCTLVPEANLDVTSVMTACTKYGGGCTAVQCTRLNNPAASLERTPGIPFTITNQTALSMGHTYQPCYYPSIDDRVKAGCTTPHKLCNETTIRRASTSFDDQVCFGLQPYRNQDLQAAEDFMISDDPLDPRWYSTCWFKVPNGGFVNVPTITNEYSPWKAGDQCVTCSYRKSVQSSATSAVANWADSLTSVCVNCENPDL